MRSGARSRAAWLAAPLVLLLAACTATEATPDAEEQPVPFAGCASLTGAPPSGAAAPAGDAAADLPQLELPCFAGGEQVSLAELRGPAVITLWGSWCGPCREELPVMQELADATEGRLRVLGVNTRDKRDHGASFAADHGITMPTLCDPEQKLLLALGRTTLPLTVFVDETGEQYVWTGRALDKPALGELVRTRAGVTVTGGGRPGCPGGGSRC